jgi:PAS domain S-box-containing protein
MSDRHGSLPPSGQISILHLEDNARDAELIKHRLQVGGIAANISLVTSREEFEAALDRGVFDLVLCDYNLPGYHGISALQLARHVQPDASVIMISGSVGEDEAVKCLQSGATDYLLKQRLDRLVPAISRALKDAEDRRSRERTEAALQERERRLSSIFDAVDDMLFYIEVEASGTYRMVSVNPAFAASTGLHAERIIGKTFDAVFPTPEVGLGHFGQAIRERRGVRWEETVELPNGRRTGEISVTPVFDSNGRCTHLVGAVHDITERRQLEAQLLQAQKMESVGQLAGGIAHDFNNLLTVINGLAELVLDKVHEGTLDGVDADLDEIRRAGERAAGLTRQLLAFSRKQIMRPQVMNLSAVVSDLAKMLQRLLGEDIELTIAATAPAFVHADRGQIEQVITNLSVNARDAMPQGGALAIEVNSETIDDEGSTIAEPGMFVTLVVRDTGTGMDEDTRRQIFEPFFTTKGAGKGTGLGLSTVYGIVKQSNGHIRVDSEVGRGARFTIYLPQAKDAAAAQLRESVPSEQGGTETVLIVEDVIGVRHLMTRVLESAGYTVLSAGTGVEAIAVLDGYPHRVDLLITDVVMPGMSGRELAERVCATRPELQMLYMSGYTDDVVLRHIVLEQGTPFISKPFTKAQLLSMIRQLLGAR